MSQDVRSITSNPINLVYPTKTFSILISQLDSQLSIYFNLIISNLKHIKHEDDGFHIFLSPRRKTSCKFLGFESSVEKNILCIRCHINTYSNDPDLAWAISILIQIQRLTEQKKPQFTLNLIKMTTAHSVHQSFGYFIYIPISFCLLLHLKGQNFWGKIHSFSSLSEPEADL